MLRRLFVRLRKKDRSAREQFALLLAGGFTFVIFAGWVLTIPGRFGDWAPAKPVDDLADFQDEVMRQFPERSQPAPTLEAIPEATYTSSTAETDVVIPNEFPRAASAVAPTETRSIRLVGVSSSTASSTE